MALALDLDGTVIDPNLETTGKPCESFKNESCQLGGYCRCFKEAMKKNLTVEHDK